MNTTFPLRTSSRPLVRAGSIALMAWVASAAIGCSILGKPAPDDSRYFVLSTVPFQLDANPSRTRSDLYFGLGPVRLPSYLKSQNLVVTGENGQVNYFPSAFWAEALDESFSRALLYRTGTRLGTTHALAYPWYSTERVDWKVPVDVLRFEATSDGRAILIARWSVERTSDRKTMAAAESMLEEQTGSDPNAVVEGLNRCVERLAETLAAAIVSSADAASSSTRSAPKR